MEKKSYYQRNREKILNKAKDYYKNNDESMQEISIGTYLKKIKLKKANMEKIDIIICLKKMKIK